MVAGVFKVRDQKNYFGRFRQSPRSASAKAFRGLRRDGRRAHPRPESSNLTSSPSLNPCCPNSFRSIGASNLGELSDGCGRAMKLNSTTSKRRVRFEMDCLDYPSRQWSVGRSRNGIPVHDVIIVGGGQSGIRLLSACCGNVSPTCAYWTAIRQAPKVRGLLLPGCIRCARRKRSLDRTLAFRV